MNRFLNGVARATAETFALPGPVLEIGSYQVSGQEEIADLRHLLPEEEYLGVDVRPGPGVDMVADVEDLPFETASIGTVIALNTFEHVPHFWRGFDEVYRVLRPDGALFVSCPFYFQVHNFPSDYWRFTPEALGVLLEKYPSKILAWQGTRKRPANVWAVAFREGRDAITEAEHQRYRARIGAYAREPLRWGRKWRYRLGRLLCGYRPFAPYLDQECWETQCRNRPVPAGRAPLVPDPEELRRETECRSHSLR
jgi:SAM-dependent methyltransferase